MAPRSRAASYTFWFIFFKRGKAVSADLSQADGSQRFRATKRGDLYLIQAGHERYEIVEALVYGG